jgi:hypothetical protein
MGLLMQHRRVALGLVLMLALLLAVQPAAAGRLWCSTDPLVSVDGRTVSIIVAIPVDDVTRVTGPTSIVVTTPAGLPRIVLVDDVGYGYGTVISFADGHTKVRDHQFPVTISVTVPVSSSSVLSTEDVPLQVTAWTSGVAPVTVTGAADRTDVTITLYGP